MMRMNRRLDKTGNLPVFVTPGEYLPILKGIYKFKIIGLHTNCHYVCNDRLIFMSVCSLNHNMTETAKSLLYLNGV